jgi:osmotically-inducible protein OsmY
MDLSAASSTDQASQHGMGVHKDGGKATSPDLVVVGGKEQTMWIQEALSSLAVLFRTTEDVGHAAQLVTPATIGVVLAEPLRGIDLEEAVKRLRACGEDEPLPVFVVVSDRFTDDSAQQLYAAGAQVVFEWPAEVLLLPPLVLEMLGVRVKPGQADVALSASVNARLKVSEQFGDGVSAEVRHGSAVVEGTVESLWKKHRLEHLLAHVPGVRSVDTHDVVVAPPDVPDRDLSRAVDDVIHSATELDTSTVSVSARDGAVILAGTLSDKAQLRRLVRLIGNVEGVRRIENLVTLSNAGAERARAAAHEIEDQLREQFPAVHVEVAVFGDVCVLSGEVPNLALRREIAHRVADRRDVERVVNKLSVP